MTGRLSPDRQDEGTWTALPDIGDRAARGTTRNRPSAVATAGITARYGARTFISAAQVALAGGTTQQEEPCQLKSIASESTGSSRNNFEARGRSGRPRVRYPGPGSQDVVQPRGVLRCELRCQGLGQQRVRRVRDRSTPAPSFGAEIRRNPPRTDRSLTFPPSPLPFPTGARAGRAWRNT